MSRYGASKTNSNDKRVLETKAGLGFYEEEYLDSSSVMRQWLVNKLPLLDADGEVDKIVTVALEPVSVTTWLADGIQPRKSLCAAI